MSAEPLRIYLDACCLNRPFDDYNQDLIRMEAEAVKGILRKSDRGIYLWISSEVLVFEIQQTSDVDRQQISWNWKHGLMKGFPSTVVTSNWRNTGWKPE